MDKLKIKRYINLIFNLNLNRRGLSILMLITIMLQVFATSVYAVENSNYKAISVENFGEKTGENEEIKKETSKKKPVYKTASLEEDKLENTNLEYRSVPVEEFNDYTEEAVDQNKPNKDLGAYKNVEEKQKEEKQKNYKTDQKEDIENTCKETKELETITENKKENYKKLLDKKVELKEKQASLNHKEILKRNMLDPFSSINPLKIDDRENMFELGLLELSKMSNQKTYLKGANVDLYDPIIKYAGQGENRYPVSIQWRVKIDVEDRDCESIQNIFTSIEDLGLGNPTVESVEEIKDELREKTQNYEIGYLNGNKSVVIEQNIIKNKEEYQDKEEKELEEIPVKLLEEEISKEQKENKEEQYKEHKEEKRLEVSPEKILEKISSERENERRPILEGKNRERSSYLITIETPVLRLRDKYSLDYHIKLKKGQDIEEKHIKLKTSVAIHVNMGELINTKIVYLDKENRPLNIDFNSQVAIVRTISGLYEKQNTNSEENIIKWTVTDTNVREDKGNQLSYIQAGTDLSQSLLSESMNIEKYKPDSDRLYEKEKINFNEASDGIEENSFYTGNDRTYLEYGETVKYTIKSKIREETEDHYFYANENQKEVKAGLKALKKHITINRIWENVKKPVDTTFTITEENGETMTVEIPAQESTWVSQDLVYVFDTRENIRDGYQQPFREIKRQVKENEIEGIVSEVSINNTQANYNFINYEAGEILENNREGKLTVQVLSSVDEKPLSEAELVLYKDIEQKNIADTKITNNEGIAIFKSLEEGKYYLKESKSKEGYKKSDEIWTIEINRQGEKIINGKEIEGKNHKTIKFKEDRNSKEKLEISNKIVDLEEKTIEEENKRLEQDKSEIENKPEDEKITQQSEEFFIGNERSAYIPVIEENIEAKSQLENTIDITIKSVKIQMVNFVAMEKSIQGKDIPLAGVEFALQKKDGENWIDYRREKSAKDTGKFTFSELEKGDYRLIVTKTPVGYEKSEEPLLNFKVEEEKIIKEDQSLFEEVETIYILPEARAVVRGQREYPETGGIGSALFLVLGISLISVAYVGFKRQEAFKINKRGGF